MNQLPSPEEQARMREELSKGLAGVDPTMLDKIYDTLRAYEPAAQWPVNVSDRTVGNLLSVLWNDPAFSEERRWGAAGVVLTAIAAAAALTPQGRAILSRAGGWLSTTAAGKAVSSLLDSDEPSSRASGLRADLQFTQRVEALTGLSAERILALRDLLGSGRLDALERAVEAREAIG